MAWSALSVLVLIGLIFFGGFVVTVMMLAHRKTRVAGLLLVMIGLGLVLVFIGGAALFWWRAAAPHEAIRAQQQAMLDEQRMRASLQAHHPWVDAGPPAIEVVPGSHADAPAPIVQGPGVAPSSPSPEPRTLNPEPSVLSAIGRALGKAAAAAKQHKPPPAAPNPVAEKEPPALAHQPQTPAGQVKPVVDQAKVTAPTSEAANDNQQTPAERPSWLSAKSGNVDGVYQTVVRVGPYKTVLECDANEPGELQQALSEYVEGCLGAEAAGRVRLTPEIRRSIVKETYDETDEFDVVGSMIQRYVLLRFDRHAKELIAAEHNKAIVAGRLWYLGVGLAVVLALLSVLFAGLKIDLATQGAYRGRLCVAAVAVMLPVVVVAYLLLASVQGHQTVPQAAPPHVLPAEAAPAAPAGEATPVVAEAAKAVYPKLALLGLLALSGTLGLVLLLFGKRTRLAGALLLALIVASMLLLVS